MNTTELTQVYEVLHQRRPELAEAWLKMLSQITPTPLSSEMKPKLEQLLAHIFELLASEPFTPLEAQEIGKSVDAINNYQPKDWITIQEFLVEQIAGELSPEQQLAIYPRLAAVIAGVGAGAYLAKADRTRAFDMNAMSKMGHDLKTPINAITGFSRVILKGIDGPITEFQEQDLTSIYEAGKKLLAMINDTFEVAKSDARKTQLYPPTFEVSDLLGDVVATIQPILASRGHSMELRAVGALGTMRANASQVRWVLLSLLLYTAQLADNRTITLTVTRERSENNEWVLFEIAETLPDELLGHEEIKRKLELEHVQENGDIGIITAQRFCEEMGGYITMGIEENGLAKLSAHLPIRAATAE